MQIIKTIRDMQALSRSFRVNGKTIGFVPTMGALHEGHLSLVRRSRDECDMTVVSIFVNPTQFGPKEDYARYPRDQEGDLKKLESMGVDAVFMPEVREMYPESADVTIDVGNMGRILCGRSRPGHFNGVALVVTKLFNIVMPDRAYFGQKDFQQSVIIRRLVRDLNFDIDIIVCPIVREPDGLAMSSRNLYLSNEEKQAATILYKALKLGKDLILSRGIKDASSVKQEMSTIIASEPLARIDYIEIVDTENLHSVNEIVPPVALCLAVWVGNTRLIDNLIVGDSPDEPADNLDQGIEIRQIGATSIGGFIEERLGGFMKKIKRLESFDLYNIVISEVEKSVISMVLKETKGNQLRAAKLLGINRNTLRSKIKRLGIKIK
jgi:pantoate--beta-alanine ligase